MLLLILCARQRKTTITNLLKGNIIPLHVQQVRGHKNDLYGGLSLRTFKESNFSDLVPDISDLNIKVFVLKGEEILKCFSKLSGGVQLFLFIIFLIFLLIL